LWERRPEPFAIDLLDPRGWSDASENFPRDMQPAVLLRFRKARNP
jgi:hypothetical protein